MIVDTVQTVTASRIGSGLRSAWRAVLQAAFLVLCVRFLVATFQQSYPDFGPALTLITGSAVLGAWRPRAALFAFVCAVPLLNGLGYVGLNGIPSPSSIVFSALFMGITCRWIFRCAKELKGRKPESPLRKDAGEAEEYGLSASVTATLLADLLITVVLVSLIGQMVRHLGDVSFWPKFWSQPVFGYGDSLYSVTSASIWLQGLFFARSLLVESNRQTVGLLAAIITWFSTILIFTLIQAVVRLPAPYDPWGNFAAYTAPFEDIHSFGAWIVVIWTYATFTVWGPTRPKYLLFTVCWLVLLLLIFLSWSRITWATAVLVSVFYAWNRYGRRMLLIAGLGILAGLIVLNFASLSPRWQQDPYLWRIGSLVRFESPVRKDPGRMNLYHKALGMIGERPLTGHGIGSVYLKSVNYAKPGDPYADIPNFAHNCVLQLGAELGVPAALLLGGLIALALIRGYRCSLRLIRTPSSDLPIFGLTMALTAFLITQMTANALNIYASNQFLFWFLMAALLCGTTSDPSRSAGALTRQG